MDQVNYNYPVRPSWRPTAIIHTSSIQQTIHLTGYNFKISFPVRLAVKSTCVKAPGFSSKSTCEPQ